MILMDKEKTHSLRLLVILYLFTTLITWLVAEYADAPFVFVFKHTEVMMLAVTLYLGLLGVSWDGLLFVLSIIIKIVQYHKWPTTTLFLTIPSLKKFRFFPRGIFPLILVVITAFIIYGTGNITLISLKFLESTTEWRDVFFWSIEQSHFTWITSLPIDVNSWDLLYHSAWGIELFAAFILILISSQSRTTLAYCVSMILLYYTGRYLGVLNPVQGPAFFNPELFTYLSGSVTDTAMIKVAEIMAAAPEVARDQSGVLLGGVSAMPSLHLGMVTLTSFWLAYEKRATLFISIPWVLLVWTSTVVLGWHYILDGAGGIVLGLLCVWATYRILGLSETRSMYIGEPETVST